MLKLEENVLNLECKAKGKYQLCKNQQGKVNELESQLESKTELYRLLEKQLLQHSEGLKGKDKICSNFQRKVKELENRLKEREQAEFVTQYKVKEFENTLKERTREFEVHSGMLQQKIVELELKLSQQGASCSNEKFKTTHPRISRVENIHDMGPPTLRCLNSNEGNQTMSIMGSSDLLKGTDSLRALKRNRQSQSKGTENNCLLSASFLQESMVSSESNKGVRRAATS
ncbi:hypothetical protein Dsin_007693 [Dipteronia sinensis]|uniref:Uncharacterized protein n=1 Tax=Dipteronia sinensis TaxID=43782 RepID=A0AAE0B0M7_9ROSI|nr:hypothetical protein Dsin_007693 [Dipteronia sinensis]